MKKQLILHVENDPNDILLVQRAFREVAIPHPVQVADNGERAVEYLSGQGEFADRTRYPLPCLIFLDLSMPRMNGIEVLTWIRQQPLVKRIPVIIFSSSKHNRDVSAAYDMGASSYMVKPVSYRELVEQVRAFKAYWLSKSELPDMARAISA